MPRLSESEAVAVLKAAGAKPLVPYPGRVDDPWSAQCIECKAEIAPTVHNARRSGACKKCGDGKRAKAERMPEGQAVAVMITARLTPQAPYPGNARTPWLCLCESCKSEVTPTLVAVSRTGKGCVECGRKAAAERNRVVRRRLPRIPTPEQAAEEMRAAGYIPLQPYPGTTNRAWPCTCTACGKPSTPKLSNVRGGTRCDHCARVAIGDAARISHGTAVAEVQAAGYEPLEPYPGKAKAPWRLRCERCQEEVTPRLSSIRYGYGCFGCKSRKNQPST